LELFEILFGRLYICESAFVLVGYVGDVVFGFDDETVRQDGISIVDALTPFE